MATDLPLADELAAVFARASNLLLTTETATRALGLITTAAREAVPGSYGAGVTLIDALGHRRTTAATADEVERADALQYEFGEGPCLSAWATRKLVRVDDVRSDPRWPQWSAAMASSGLRSSLSTPLLAGDVALGAVKIYSDRTAAFDGHSEEMLVLFAAQATIFLVNVQARESASRLSDELQETMARRDLIGPAKGIMMARKGLGEEEALGVLLATARHSGKPLDEVASEIVTSALHPGR